MSPVTACTTPSSTPSGTEMRWVVAPAASTALRGSSSSTCSTPVAASTAIRLPVNSAMVRSCPVAPIGETLGAHDLLGPEPVLAEGPVAVHGPGAQAAEGDRVAQGEG